MTPYEEEDADDCEARWVFRRPLSALTPSKGAPSSGSTPSRYTAREMSQFTRDSENAEGEEGGDYLLSAIEDNPVLDIDEDAEYAVWVSFFEVYNELIFDLLVETAPEEAKRVPLKIKSEKIKHGLFRSEEINHFVEGLTEVRVCDMQEASTVLRRGQRNRRVFSTLLNQHSSRSHGCFTVKIVKLPVINGSVVEDPSVIRATKFSVLDLAGSERYTKTRNVGERLQEAGNINKSLMTLGKCMAALSQNQSNPSKKPLNIPYRESKLTFLFQKVFQGQSRAVRAPVTLPPTRPRPTFLSLSLFHRPWW